ncbi:hypothetical protein UFOVP119_94 [uncultured Caudovirales phage]|uniref:Uncharacterized protein n=1 Tax=uncultured Caudovirales phage TaxID=2100421 RepID=A0A6J5LC06_9CAUD|nr:hypothetical protein UFOVP119_94 [uncultured Caudovirales phage]
MSKTIAEALRGFASPAREPEKQMPLTPMEIVKERLPGAKCQRHPSGAGWQIALKGQMLTRAYPSPKAAWLVAATYAQTYGPKVTPT